MADDALLEAAALRALAADYTQLNWSLFAELLQPVPLSLSGAEGRLGAFQREPRGIELSRALVMGQPWGQVQEVLKHEMAHQFVDEVLGIRDEAAHGASFRRVCAERGIDSRASGAPSDASAASTGGPLQRVRKLLALADSPNRHEAEAAMRTAHRLMLKHNLQAVAQERGGAGAGEGDYGYRHLGTPTGRSTAAERAVGGLLGEFFFVQPIWVSVFRVRDGKRVNVLEVTGRPENLAMAEYVYDFLLAAADRLWLAHKRTHGIRRNADRQAYRAGVVLGFADKLRAERTAQHGAGLVWVGDAAADAHFRARHPRVRTTRRGSAARNEAAGHGRRAGQGLVLNRPVGGGAGNRGHLLPSG